MEFILGAEEYITQSVSECKRVFCAVRLKRKKKPEGLARIQAGGKRSATPATGHIIRKPRMGGRILQQCVSTLLLCHPFGVYWGQLDSKEFFRVSCGNFYKLFLGQSQILNNSENQWIRNSPNSLILGF